MPRKALRWGQMLNERPKIQTETPPGPDIWRAAHLLIEQHGKNAGVVAALRADELLFGGDDVRGGVWLKIFRAIEEIWSRERGEVLSIELVDGVKPA